MHETHWNVVHEERCTELSPRDLVVVLKSGGLSGPPGHYGASKLLGNIQSLLVLCVVKQTEF
jgi:hypothetical protein